MFASRIPDVSEFFVYNCIVIPNILTLKTGIYDYEFKIVLTIPNDI